MQERLRDECNAVLSDKGFEKIDGSTFDGDTMPYLAAVCIETLRLYPTVPATVRHSVKPTTLGGHHIPAETLALISPWAINRDPKFWGADADRYNPDRWLMGENAMTGGAKSPYSLVTFLHGPRSCIGQTFARTEMKCLLAAMIMRFRFELADPGEKIEVAGLITIKPRNGLRLKLYEL
jgi:cytochrome P450